MSYRLVTFESQVDRWLGRHRWVKANKIKSIVLHKHGEIHHNPDGTYILITGVVNKGKPVKLFIKVRENSEPRIIYVDVIKIHAGHIAKILDFYSSFFRAFVFYPLAA